MDQQDLTQTLQTESHLKSVKTVKLKTSTVSSTLQELKNKEGVNESLTPQRDYRDRLKSKFSANDTIKSVVRPFV